MDEGDSNQSVSPVGRSLSADELLVLVAGAPFLDGLAPEVVADVAAVCELVQIAGDRQLLHREAPNDSLYVVVHGGLRTMARDEHGREYVVAESHRGDSVGMLGLLPGVAVGIDVFAIRDSILLRLTRARFMSLGDRLPDLAMRLAAGIARRSLALLGHQPQWTTWKRPGATVENIALLLPSRDREFASSAAAFARAAFARYRRVGWINRESLDRAMGAGAAATFPGVDEERVLAFLESVEVENDTVFYEGDTTVLPWSERCLRQADRILVVLRAQQSEDFDEVRPILQRGLPRKYAPRIEVALLHPESVDVPSRSAAGWAWLMQNARIHHLRTGSSRDYERLARTLVHSGIALVLSGGGARGIAHLGVLKALEDAQFPVDAIAGTSMGSIFAAGYARGWGVDVAMAKVRELFSRRAALYDPTIPFEALFAGRKLTRVLEGYFGGIDIETLWLPFFCVSTNLLKANPRIHDRGELWRAVAASCSIPGIFPPRREGDDYLVDGGVINNLPIDIMAARFEGAIIASDVSVDDEAAASPASPPAPGKWEALRRLLHPRQAHRGPRILETLMRTSTVGSRQTVLTALARGKATLHLQVPAPGFGMLDWRAHDQIYAAGYEAATRQLAGWVPPWKRGRTPPSGMR